MYARLWWKDLRQFWPIWLFLVVAAMAVQGLMLLVAGANARHGSLLLLAIFWSGLYALTAGAAAFAGEREVGGLRLLDALPAPRRVVWSAKVSFAVVSSMVLILVLIALAALGTDDTEVLKSGGETVSALEFVIGVGFVFSALGWGLFFSSFTASAITAAVLGIIVCGLSVTLVPDRINSWGVHPTMMFGGLALVPLTALATIAASGLIFSFGSRQRRSVPNWNSPIQFRSPVVINIPVFQRPALVRLQSPITITMVSAPRPAVMIGTTTHHAIRRFPRSRYIELVALVWQTLREGRGMWWLLFAVSLVFPFLVACRDLDAGLFAALDVLGLLAAGVSVFGIEHQARSQRVLAHHAARPRLVWLAKIGVWSAGLVILMGVQLASYVLTNILWSGYPMGQFWSGYPTGRMYREGVYAFLGVFIPFGIAQLCGMTIRRTITAGVIALVFTILFGLACGGLMVAGLFPIAGFPIISVALLLVSWAWAGDWMLDGPGARRWLRLLGLLSGTFAVLFVWYVGNRAWGVSDPGSIAPPANWSHYPVTADQNAAELYRQAADLTRGEIKDKARRHEAVEKARELVRQATERPNCVFFDPKKMTIMSDRDAPDLLQFTGLVHFRSGELRATGDLAGAWESILVEFRLALHAAQTLTNTSALRHLQFEQMALSNALVWAVDGRQTLELLRAAKKSLRDLAPLPAMADVMSGEANIVEQTLDLPSNDLKGVLNVFVAQDRDGRTPFQKAALIEVETTPWELVRARRLVRQAAADAIQIARLSPLDRALRDRNGVVNRFYESPTSPLAQLLISPGFYLNGYGDRMLMGRRALEQIIAIRSWQLRHAGAFPDQLEQLVPEDLDHLPLDPYSEQPFRYVVRSGQPLVRLEEVLNPQPSQFLSAGSLDSPEGPPERWRLLYSVGPDLRDDQANINMQNTRYDYVFPIPPLETKPKK